MPVDEFVINVIIDKYSFCIQSIFYHFFLSTPKSHKKFILAIQAFTIIV